MAGGTGPSAEAAPVVALPPVAGEERPG